MIVVRWRGASGKDYGFDLHQIGSLFIAVPACYIFTKVNPVSGGWLPIYIGQTVDLSERIEFHHAKSCVQAQGATHICAYTRRMHLTEERLTLEHDLIAAYRPPCNYS